MVALEDQYKLNHKDTCLEPFTKVKRIYIRAYKVGKGQYFEPLGLICESCFSISLSESYCKKMNDRPVRQLTSYEVRKCISKGMKTYEEMLKSKNRVVSNEELTIEKSH